MKVKLTDFCEHLLLIKLTQKQKNSFTYQKMHLAPHFKQCKPFFFIVQLHVIVEQSLRILLQFLGSLLPDPSGELGGVFDGHTCPVRAKSGRQQETPRQEREDNGHHCASQGCLHSHGMISSKHILINLLINIFIFHLNVG